MHRPHTQPSTPNVRSPDTSHRSQCRRYDRSRSSRPSSWPGRHLPPRLRNSSPNTIPVDPMQPATIPTCIPPENMGPTITMGPNGGFCAAHTEDPHGQVYPPTPGFYRQIYPPTTGPQPHPSVDENVIYRTPPTVTRPPFSRQTPPQTNHLNTSRLIVTHPASSQQSSSHHPNASTTFTPPSGSSGYQRFVPWSNCQPPAISEAYFDACGVHPGTDAYQELVDALGQARHQIQSTESTDPQPCKGFDPFWDEHS